MSRAGKTSKSRAKKTTRSTRATRTKSTKSAKTASSAKTAKTARSARTGKSAKTGKQLQLPAVLDLTAAAPLAKSLLSRRGAELSVDASRVNRVGAQCLQVLVAAAETWKTDGVGLRLVKPTPEFLEGSRLLGIHLD